MVKVSVTLKVKPVRETVVHFHVSKCTVSKRQHCFILHPGDGRQCLWHRHGEPCWVTTGATWCQWRGGRIWGDIFNMAGWNWCKLTGHRIPQSTTQKSWPVICCRTGMLWATRELLTSFCCTTTAHPTQCDWLRLDCFQPHRQGCCIRGWLGAHGVKTRSPQTRPNKCDQNASLAYRGPWA